MNKIIDGKKIAKTIKDNVAKEIYNLKKGRPNLAIILVGDRPDSELYVGLKQKQAKTVGIDTHLYKIENNTTEEELLNVVDFLNNDSLIDGVLIQLPLPEKIDSDKIVNRINPEKDVDGFHKDNLKNIEKEDVILSPVFLSVLESFKDIGLDIKDKKIVILYNSDIFGKSLAKLLEKKKAKVKTVQQKEINKKGKEIKEADIIITAIGKANFIKGENIKKDVVIIDIGITKEDKKVYGDADMKSVFNKVSYITPVPGGIGPMTIAMLFKNTLQVFKNRQKKNDK
ncbi:bifunctional 5,10-methylenetetrahydrofolate dehydrogenase/5,10-methenyltetrahydrofolate cyclohydrolase [bacterium]|nr:bifunctional 5,10-methylenetetrahydrofolate dehydrogenase/5,10-methenyltetrahydrofolate cyclohydrolase [bacterium]